MISILTKVSIKQILNANPALEEGKCMKQLMSAVEKVLL